MPPLKLIATLFFVASTILGGIGLKNAYGSYADRTNTDVSRAAHVIQQRAPLNTSIVGPRDGYEAKSRRVEVHFVLRGGVCGGRDAFWEFMQISDRLGTIQE
jgi:hypothetical protein